MMRAAVIAVAVLKLYYIAPDRSAADLHAHGKRTVERAALRYVNVAEQAARESQPKKAQIRG